ncbi:sensor histidine kinase [Nonomuraea sp. NPDC050310]|uniref:sensor histidine kinase n=1 Tax=unclassified Nonomuraea TaxID=2593643 RepID=UPI0033C81DFB
MTHPVLRHRVPPTPLDWTIAVAVLVFALAEELGDGGGRPLWLAAAVTAGVLVLVRRRLPATVLAVYSAQFPVTLYFGNGVPAAWGWYVELLLLFTLMAEAAFPSRRLLLGLGCGAFAMVSLFVFSPTPIAVGDVTIAFFMAAIACGAGVAVRRHQETALAAHERGELLARQAVVEERNRIARELHDIVAHSVSVMTMQAGAVRLMLKKEQSTERETLTLVEGAGREAVEELRRMLGLLRTPGDDERTPQPGLERLEELVEQMCIAGLDVHLIVHGHPVPLSPGLGLSVYRIVQESLTNTLKHAGPTKATVTLSYRPRELRVDIEDEGLTGKPGPPGHGLIGMRERVALFHGRLTAGPAPQGGYSVRVDLPL